MKAAVAVCKPLKKMPLPQDPVVSGVNAAEVIDKTSDIAEKLRHKQDSKTAECEHLQNLEASPQMPEFVSESIYAVQEKSSCCRQNVGLLMSTLMRKSVVSNQHYLDGVIKLVQNVRDNPPTSPDVWVNIAESIAPVLSSGMVRFSELHNIVGPPVCAPRLLTEVLTLLLNEKGQDWIDSQWDVSEISWTGVLETPIEDFSTLTVSSKTDGDQEPAKN